jgi:dienelactone hydrolase
MKSKLLFVFTLIICLFIPMVALANESAEESTLIYENEVVKIPEGKIFMDGKIYKPEGEGPFPLVVITHGRNSSSEVNAKRTVNDYSALAKTLIRKKFAVVFVLRRGYGTSQGGDNEGFYTNPSSNMYPAAKEAGKDIKATVEFMKIKPYIDSSKIILMGHSMGGQAVMAALTMKIPGVIGVVNFAGGLAYRDSSGRTNGDLALIDLWAQFGKENNTVPTLWIYANNDSHFDPGLVSQMYTAYTKHGGKATYIPLNAIGEDGHDAIMGVPGIKMWLPSFNDYLRSIGLEDHIKSAQQLILKDQSNK